MSVVMFGQVDEIKVDGNYFFNDYSSYNNANSKIIGTLTAQANVDFATLNLGVEKPSVKVVSIDANGIVTFKYRMFKDVALKNKFNGNGEKLYYKMTVSEFKKMMSVYYDRLEWKVGFFAVPYKLRFNDFDFESDISLGANLSAKFRFNRMREDGFALEPVIFGLGISKINLDEFNSRIDAPGSSNAFTINSGLLIHVNGKINFGIFYGADFLAKRDNSKYDWKHNGNGWLGAGLNISFSETNPNKGSL